MREHELKAEIRALEAGAAGQPFTEGQRKQWNGLNEQLDEYRTRRERILELAGRGSVEEGTDFRHSATRAPLDDEAAPEHVRLAHDAGLFAVERSTTQGHLTPQAADRLDTLIRRDDPAGLGARYLAAVGNPDYSRAFQKILFDPQTAHLRMSREEQTAVQEVVAAEQARAMVAATGSSGGFGLPIEIDPTITLLGAGALNPIREVATVRTMASLTLRLVSADQVTAGYAAEVTEASDNSPTLAQPTITAAKGQAFIPYSIEVGMDYPDFANELAKILADARAVVDNTQFLTGTGTNAPQGVLTGLSSTSWRQQTATVSVTAIADAYALKNAVPARHLPNCVFAAHPATWDVFYRFVGGGSTEPSLFSAANRGGDFLGYPKVEWTAMATAVTTTGTKIMLAGDWKAGFVIADRIGAQLEIVPLLMGATNRFPTGQRGAYFWWRTGSAVVATATNAPLRWLEVK